MVHFSSVTARRIHSGLTPRSKPVPKKHKTLVVCLILGLVLSLLCLGAYYFYDNVYVQRIQSMDVAVLHRDQATVVLDTDIDSTLLTLVCSDSHGNSIRQAVVGNQVVFTGLKPNISHIRSCTGLHRIFNRQRV